MAPIPEHKVAKVKELIALHWSYRSISKAVGVARATVVRIAQNKPMRRKEDRFPAGPLVVLPPRWCPTCGFFRAFPCPACRAEECDSPERLRRRNATDTGAADLEIALVGEERLAWLRVRAALMLPLCDMDDDEDVPEDEDSEWYFTDTLSADFT